LLAAYLISEKNVSINRILLYVLFAYIQNFWSTLTKLLPLCRIYTLF
jgi:hypothetical protein